MSDPERMIARLRPAPGAPEAVVDRPARLGFLIEIPGDDGRMLLRMFERGGRLAVECDEDRLEEGAKRFVHMMMQWSGVVGIRWKDEAVKAAGE